MSVIDYRTSAFSGYMSNGLLALMYDCDSG
jgi:hypothetical protein